MLSDILPMLALLLIPVSLYIIPTCLSRLVIKPDRRWSSDAPLLIVFFAFWLFSLTLRRGAGIYNLLFEPALLAAAPIAFWLLLNLRFVTRLKLGDQPIGSQLLVMIVGVCVLVLFPLIPPRGPSS